MQYHQTVNFHGNLSEALSLAAGVLVSIGFRIDEKGADFITVSGSGMYSTRQNPLKGATQIELTHHDGELELTADMGGIKKLSRFVIWFPMLVMGIVAVVAIGAVWIASMTMPDVRDAFGRIVATVVTICLVGAVPGIAFGPFIAKLLSKRTREALDSFLKSICA